MNYVCKAYLRSSPIYVTPLDQNAGFSYSEFCYNVRVLVT